MRSNLIKIFLFSMTLLSLSLAGSLVPSALSFNGSERSVSRPSSENPLFSVQQGSESTSYRSIEGGGAPQVLRSRQAKVNLNAIFEGNARDDRSAKPAGKIDLNLFEGARYKAIAKRILFFENGGLVWMGKVEGDPLSSVSLAVLGDAFDGHIRLAYADFAVEYVGKGLCRISEIDAEKFPKEHDPVYAGTPGEKSLRNYPIHSNYTLPMSDDGSTIDVLVAYTAAARSARGGTEGILNFINLAIADANASYENSGISQRLNLAGTYEVDYTETGNLDIDLDRLQASWDSYMNDVHTIREDYCADAVVLIVDNGGDYCGLSFQMIGVSSPYNSYYAFAIVADGCAVSNHSFPHELGHIMGAQHDLDNAIGTGEFEYSYGYVAPDYSFRTIMAYPSGGAPRVPYWSNPDINYGGLPMGIAGEADNRMTLNNTAAVVANFRQSCSATPPSANFTADMTSGLRPLQVTFTDSSTGDVTSYYWEFGDGGSSTEANPVHEYETAGTYTVSLTVDGPNGSDTLYRNDYIQVYELHDADTEDPAGTIDGGEASRILAYWRAGAYHCDETGQDGYAPGDGDSSCDRHSADYQEPYWALDGSETSRVLAYWRAGGYHVDETGVDGYAPGSESTSQSADILGPSATNIDARHSVDTGYFQPGGLVTVETQLEYSGALLSLMWRPVLPDGWQIQSVSGDGDPEYSGGEILWTGTLPPSPVSLSYTVRVPDSETEDSSIRNQVLAHMSGDANPIQQYAAPDPILLAADKPFNPSGIYKSSDLSTNVFLQTYDAGSMLILFTSDLVTFHVFLDPDWSDGILDISDQAGNGHRLSILFTDESTAVATVTYADQSVDSWQISRAFDASRTVDAPDGIYKTAQESMNAYVQTYTTGSMVAILTADLEEFLVFLDPDWQDGISVSSDLGENGKGLTMTESASGSYSATIYSSGGQKTSYALALVFSAQD